MVEREVLAYTAYRGKFRWLEFSTLQEENLQKDVKMSFYETFSSSQTIDDWPFLHSLTRMNIHHEKLHYFLATSVYHD